MAISVKPEPLFFEDTVLPVTNSLLTAIIIVVLLIIFFVVYQKKITVKPRSRLQLSVEWVVSGINSLAGDIMGKKISKTFFPLVFTFFILIILSNWSGLVPLVGGIGWVHDIEESTKPILSFEEGITATQEVHTPFLRPPSTDLNFTIALAIISFVAIQYAGLKHLGVSYLGKFFDFRVKAGKGWKLIGLPFVFLGNAFLKLLELVLEIGKIISFAFRLFGNIFAGKVLLIVVTGLTLGVASLPFYGLEIFVGFIQTVVFTFLTMVFIKTATDAHH
jgi:F-type H+-transporting ATPase subunit a